MLVFSARGRERSTPPVEESLSDSLRRYGRRDDGEIGDAGDGARFMGSIDDCARFQSGTRMDRWLAECRRLDGWGDCMTAAMMVRLYSYIHA